MTDRANNFLLYNFDSFRLILLKFTPHLNHQTTQVLTDSICTLWIFSTLSRYITDILKMCLKKFDGEKKYFFDKLTGFLSYPFSDNCT